MHFAKQYLSVPWSLFRKRSNFLVLTNTRLSRSEVINLQFSKFQFDSAKKSTLRVENWKEPPLLQAREKSSKSQVCKKRKTDYKLAPCPDLPEFIASKPRKWARPSFSAGKHQQDWRQGQCHRPRPREEGHSPPSDRHESSKVIPIPENEDDLRISGRGAKGQSESGRG